MENPGSASPAHPAAHSPAAHLPPAIRELHRHFTESGDPAALDALVLAILEDYVPRRPARPLSELPGETLLMDDLGFDSLAITEVIFCTEDLFRIRISNEEILQVRSLNELLGFVRAKVGARPVA